MSRIRPDQLLLPSVLDRLLDDEPHQQVEAERSRAQLMRELKQSVRRDLENLLNTRICLYPIPSEFPEYWKNLENSLINYGIPDLGGLMMGSRSERESLRKQIEFSIRHFETRFKQVQVFLVDDRGDNRDRTVRFRIDGMLHAEPTPEPVVFDSQLQPSSGDFTVKASQS
jgi:type VI secretion system protein ImpF